LKPCQTSKSEATKARQAIATPNPYKVVQVSTLTGF
jgi:hypothetical protein